MDDLDRLRAELLDAFVPEHRPLLTTMTSYGVAIASQSTLVRVIAGVESGKITSPYSLSRALGMTTREAKARPATGPYLAIVDYLGTPDRFTL